MGEGRRVHGGRNVVTVIIVVVVVVVVEQAVRTIDYDGMNKQCSYICLLYIFVKRCGTFGFPGLNDNSVFAH